MVPWIRLARAGIALIGAPQIGLLDSSTVRMHVWPNDLDLNLHVNNGRYLMLADIGRLDWFVRSGVLQLARRHGAMPVVADAMAKFRRELTVGQKFEIRTRLMGWDERWGFVEHRFIRGGRVLGVVAARGVFRARSGPLQPSTLLAQMGTTLESPPLPAWIQQWNTGCESLSQLLRDEEQSAGVR